MTLCVCTAGRRQDRVYQAALALILHRNGPQALVWTGKEEELEVQVCVNFAMRLEAKVESALNLPPEKF